MSDCMKEESPQKRRGRPQKKLQPFFDSGEQLFTIHDNVFHGSILFYTYRIFDRTPSRSKFNPTIGYSVYEKVRSLLPVEKEYYDDDDMAKQFVEEYSDNQSLVNFFVNSMTFGPSCVIDEFFQLFKFILRRPQVTPNDCMRFIVENKYKYMHFNCSVLQQLDVKTPQRKKTLREFIDEEILKLFEIIIHTLHALQNRCKENKFARILQNEQDLFERGVNTKSKKKNKKL